MKIDLSSVLRKAVIVLGLGISLVLPQMVTAQWTTTASATAQVADCYSLTPNVNPKVGGIEVSSQVNLNEAFTIQASGFFGNSTARHGMAFYISGNSLTGLTNSLNYGLDNVDSLLAVEFDAFFAVAENDPGQDHIGVFRNGGFVHGSSSELTPVKSMYNFQDGAYHDITIEWQPDTTNPDSSVLRIQFDCDSLIEVKYNFRDSVFYGQTTGYIGFSSSSANGGFYSEHKICLHHSSFDTLRDTVMCSYDSVQVEVPYYGTSYSWTPATNVSDPSAKSPFFSPTTTTTYTLNMTDSCGNTLTDSVTIQINPISASLSPIVGNRCALDTTLLPLTVNGGFVDSNQNYLYFWSDGWRDSIHRVTPFVSTTYFITVEDTAGCQDTSTVSITTDTLPTVNLGSGARPICEDDSIVFRAPTDPSYSYSWFPGGSTADTFVVDSTITVILSVTNGTPCIGKDTVFVTWVPRPVVNLGPDSSLCFGDVMTLDAGAGGTVYSWSPLVDTTQTVVVDSASTYSVTVTDGNFCSTSDTVVVTVDTLPVVNLGNDTALCNGDTLFLDGGPAQQAYVWSNGVFTQTNFLTTTTSISLVVVDSNDCQGSDNLNLQVDTLPTIDLGPDTSICDLDSVVIRAYSGLFSIQWNEDTLLTADSLVIDTANSYWVDIIDSNGCAGVDTMVLSIDTLPVVDLGNDTSICLGFSLNLTLDTGYAAYNWINMASSGNTLTIDTTGTYYVHVVDSNECQTSDTINLTVDTLPQIDIGNDTNICIGDVITFDAGLGYQSYLWNVGPATRLLTTDSAFTYMVTVTDFNGCIGGDTLVLGLNQLPVVNLGPDRELCVGVTVSEVLDAGPGFVNYAWSAGGAGGPGTHRTITATTQDTFRVTITDVNGCMDSDTIVVSAVQLPTVNLGPDTAYCEGDPFTFVMNTGSGFISHIWRNIVLPAGSDTVATNGQILLVDTAGTYVVDIIELFNGRNCPNSDTIQVIEMPLPNIGIAGEETVCENDVFTRTLTATAAGNYNYQWNVGGNTNSITATSPGFYTVTVTDTTGCDAEETYTIHEDPLPIIDFSLDTLLCEGKLLKLDAYNPGYTYEWIEVDDTVANTGTTFNTTDSAVWVSDSGRYLVNITNGICLGSNFVDVEYDVFPKVNLGQDVTLCFGDTLFLDATFSDSEVEYLWQDGFEESIYAATFSNLYVVEVSNRCGVDITSLFVSFEDCSNIWVPNCFTPNNDSDNDFFKVYSLEEFIDYQIEIMDQWGNLVFTSNSVDIQWDGTDFGGKPLPVGTYVYKITYKSLYEVFGPEGAPTREMVGMVNIVR
jgi:gliding motility-associated-like protein